MWKRLKLHSIKCVLDEPYVAQNPSRINRAWKYLESFSVDVTVLSKLSLKA